MPIRSSIRAVPAKRIPWELEYALEAVNNGYTYGAAKTTVENLQTEAVDWENLAREATIARDFVYADICSRHAYRYLHAATMLEQYNGARR